MTEHKQTRFAPAFVITPAIATNLMRIEAVRVEIQSLPITPNVLAGLRDTARLFSTHYSTMIEGNLLTQEQVAQVVASGEHFPGRERDEGEVKGYYAALEEVEKLARQNVALTERDIQHLHALVMGAGRTNVRATPYRDGQNVIRDSRSGNFVYMPPEAIDVRSLMNQFVAWMNDADELPVPVRAAIAHYQFATIHPYYDGNGRTARLLTTLLLHLNGYGLKGLYALEEYYARELRSYYAALTVGPSHNYYMGRPEADITGWISYFIEGMAVSFEKVRAQARIESARGSTDQTRLLRTLDARQKKALTLFRRSREITAKDIAVLFGFQPRSAALLCQRWVENGFLEITDAARKSRRYRLGDAYEAIVDGV